jgi:hypothetical protein
VSIYIGGSSSVLPNPLSDFDDDGIVNIENEDGLTDFQKNCEFDEDDPTRSDVKAFRVRFSEQNQSVFTGIDFETREHPDTNESLQILGQIAGDNGTSAPVSKGQNLFNTFETRSYTAKVSMMGNMMIQPTQYFQVENIPMFGGAYIVLNVEHEIKPHYITTNFSGYRVLKYPVPFVRDFATTIGVQGGTSDEYDIGNNEVVFDNTLIPDDSVLYNSMFTLKLDLS